MSDLKDAKEGDLIAYVQGGWSGVSVSMVVSTTKTLVKTKTHTFLRSGNLYGVSRDPFARGYARIATDADIVKVRIRKAKARLELVPVTEKNLDDVEDFLSRQELK
jgi:hypothetical protein